MLPPHHEVATSSIACSGLQRTNRGCFRLPAPGLTCCMLALHRFRYVWADGNEYDGEWRRGRMHGQGTFVWRSGERYDGEWKVRLVHASSTCATSRLPHMEQHCQAAATYIACTVCTDHCHVTSLRRDALAAGYRCCRTGAHHIAPLCALHHRVPAAAPTGGAGGRPRRVHLQGRLHLRGAVAAGQEARSGRVQAASRPGRCRSQRSSSRSSTAACHLLPAAAVGISAQRHSTSVEL